MKKRSFAIGILAVFTMMWIILPGNLEALAASGSVKIDVSSTQAPGSCVDLAMGQFKSLVEKRSDGRISVTLYRAGQLYNPKTEIDAIVKGALTIAPLHPAFVGARSPALEFIGVLGAQGCWVDREHYWRFLDLPETREIAENELKTKLNAKLLGMPSGGPGLLTNRKRPIHAIEDYKGLKTRTAGSASALLYKSLGMIPVGMSAKEVYMALQRGTIDGAATSIGRYFKSKWYEVSPYLTIDNSIPDINAWFVINLDSWNKLSKADQQILSRAAQEVSEGTRICSVKEAEESYKKLKADGLVKDLFFLPRDEIVKMNKIAGPEMHNLIKKRAGNEMGDKLWNLVLKTAEEK